MKIGLLLFYFFCVAWLHKFEKKYTQAHKIWWLEKQQFFYLFIYMYTLKEEEKGVSYTETNTYIYNHGKAYLQLSKHFFQRFTLFSSQRLWKIYLKLYNQITLFTRLVIRHTFTNHDLFLTRMHNFILSLCNW